MISNSGWIKGANNSTNSVGLTFESLFNKKSDSMYFPDYNGIEIKCTQRFSGYPISLFSLAFDGSELYEMNRILSKYGKPDIIYKDKKILVATLSFEKEVLVNNKFYFKLELDEVKERIYLVVFDHNKNLLEKEAYVDFSSIKNRLQVKLSNLAIVWASKRKTDKELYFRYYKIIIYKLTSFEKFIELLKNDVIKIEIVGRVSRSGVEAGRQRNKNLVFKINKEDVELLFDVIEKYDSDLLCNFQIL
ncbi:MAG: MvaI/BcnI restriction endonuclease family protein [Firmicutes bacterium]|nr:MvaI/BcnI restriction endonuclease family protein [Bacillota bacterium]